MAHFIRIIMARHKVLGIVSNLMNHPSEGVEAEKAFLEAYDAFASGLSRFLASKVSDPEIARDLMQETFTRAWDYCREGERIREWKPFLYRTAYNLVVDWYRKKRSLSLDVMIDDQGFSIIDRADERYVDSAEVRRVQGAIKGLDEIYRDVLLLRYTEDLPPQEIAEVLGLSENVVSVRIHRGLAKLRENITGKEKNI